MERVKLAIVYYSATGTIHALAQAAAQAAEEEGAEVRLRLVRELAPEEAIAQNPAWKAFHEAHKDDPRAVPEDLEWADAMMFGLPARYGNMPAQIKQFVDALGPIWARGGLADKPVTAFASTQQTHGGQESTILSFYQSVYHWGAYVVTPGYTDPVVSQAGGNPYGTSASQGKVGEAEKAAVAYQARRLVRVAKVLKAGREALAGLPSAH
ncbi:MAG: NAD(P)H:quinone oxidoreductase [Clostridia bacterium]|nr:NAD(P)H:quinone oxidoreductase [Clostridia bacterium]